MVSSVVLEVDFIEELRLRRWARENYLPPDKRQDGLHPIILEEMRRRDAEGLSPEPAITYAMLA